MEQVYRRRLKKLAMYMLNFDAVRNAKHFRMRTFLDHQHEEANTPSEALMKKWLEDCYCGTVACAVGHAPALFPTLVAKFDKEKGYWADGEFLGYNDDGEPRYEKVWILPSWRELSLYLFDIHASSEEFEFLFGGEWDSGSIHNYKSTSWAVADRIFWFLDGKWDTRNSRWTEGEASRQHCVTKGLISQQVLDDRMKELLKLEEHTYEEAE